MTPIDEIIANVIKIEGGYTNHPNDAGGPTMYGWTAATARAELDYVGDIKNLPYDVAHKGYKDKFFTNTGISRIYDLFPDLGILMLDAAVNHGAKRPITWLQECLNVFNKQGKIWPDIAADGQIGNGTINAVQSMITYKQAGYPLGASSVILLEAVRDRRGAFYVSLALAKQTQEDFMWGWYWNRVINYKGK